MPPAGRPRPDEAAYDGLIAHLETSLDRVAAAHPDPGRTDTFRRLNRTEYQNAIRDLLDVEVDVETLLPSDDSSHGFDNISVGGLSPMLLERYLSAAQKISRLAVGTPVRSAGAETVVLPPDLTQEDHFDGQPFGTRAGTSVRYTFPADGEYQFELRLTRDRNELIEGLTEPHQIEVSVDGVRQQMFTLKPAPRTGPVRSDVAPQYAPEQAADAHLNFRTRVTGGPHVVQVAFLKRPSALVETERQPYLASFNSDRTPRTQPALYSVSIAGPFNPTRHRRDAEPAAHLYRAGRPSRATKRRARRPSSRRWRAAHIAARPPSAEVQTLLGFYKQGRADGGFEHGIEMALRALLTSPAFLFRIEREPAVRLKADTRSRHSVRFDRRAYRISDLELASRLSFFLWSSIPDDALLDAAVKGRAEAMPAVLEQQVRRMLADPRADALVNNFAAQWLYLRNLDSAQARHPAVSRLRRQPAPGVPPRDRAVLRERRERGPQRARSAARGLHVPQRAAREALRHSERLRQPLPARRRSGRDHVRGGLLGQGSILTVTSYANRTSPVRAASGFSRICSARPCRRRRRTCRRCQRTSRVRRSLTMRERMVAASREPGLRELPSADGSGRAGDGELRCDRPLAHAERSRRRRSTRRAGCPTAARSTARSAFARPC